VLSINYSFLNDKISLQFYLSLSNSHSTANSLFNIATSQSSRPLYQSKFVGKIVSAFPPCGAGIPWDAAASNAIASCRRCDFQIAVSSSALIDLSLSFDKDWSTFKTQAKQRLSCL
jgi:hypothetical protein